MKSCSIADCGKAVHAKDMCSMHYYRQLRHGDTNHRKTPNRKAIGKRFSGKFEVDQQTGCWNWLAYKDSKGYGRIALGGKHGGDALAHRVSYELHVGEIPEGMNVLHSCDNPSCVCPQHLRAGTQLENVNDMINRERGNNWGHKKLTTAEVVQIRSEISRGEQQSETAKKHGIGESHVSRIKFGKSRAEALCA